jgi:DNA-binding transcriptional ArsR family regulator
MKQATVTPKQCAEILRAMGDETRLRILRILLVGQKCVGELVDVLGASQPHVSHHLRILRQAGLVEGVREGQRICYRLMPGVQDRLNNTNEEALDFGCCRISFSQTALVAKN